MPAPRTAIFICLFSKNPRPAKMGKKVSGVTRVTKAPNSSKVCGLPGSSGTLETIAF